MRVRTTPRGWIILAAILAVWAASLAAQQPPVRKKPISHDVYDSWRSIQGPRLSRDGTWVAYSLAAQEGDGELVVRNLRTNAEIRQPRGRDAAITADGKFVVFAIAPLRADVDKAKKDKKKPDEMPKPSLGILDLSTGKAVTYDRVKSFKLPEESGRFVAFLFEAPEKKADAAREERKEEPKAEEKKEGAKKKKEKKKEPGTDLVVRELAPGTETRVPEVVEYAWSRHGDWLAYSVSSKKPEADGAFARKTADGSVKALMTGLGNYKQLAFDEEGTQAAFVSDRDDYKADASPYRLYHWSPAAEKAVEVAAPGAAGMPKGWSVSENGRLDFSKDGARLFFGTAPAPKADPDDASDPVKVDVWHWKDPFLQPMQKVRAEEEKKRSYPAVSWLKEKKIVALADPEMPELRLNQDGTRGMGVSDVPYRQLVSWDSDYNDYYAVNLADGSRKKLIDRSRFEATLSPSGAFVLYFDYRDANWYVVRTADGKLTRLTDKSLGVRFDDETSNTPEPARPWGTAGWTEGERSVLVYDRYDIWELRPDGTAPRMITSGLGRRQKLVFRHQPTEAEEGGPAAGRGRRAPADEQVIKLDKPLLLRATDDTTKASGYYRVSVPPIPAPITEVKGKKPAAKATKAEAPPAQAAIAEPVKLLMLDKRVGAGGSGGFFVKAKDADTVVVTEQRFDEVPNLWVTDVNLASPRKISDANPQMSQYNWGRSELVDYVNADGVPLRAILTKPEDFDASKKYPMIVYIYEELTDNLHNFVAPAPGSSSINVTRFASNGYIVLQPDIVYDHAGYPGQAALKCVIPAVQRVLAMGFVDPKRVGIQGHSWGGYQITYLVTQTDMFRAVEAGASVSNMISAYGGIRWGTGMSRAFQYEKSQSRIGAPPWERPLAFIESSPIFWVEKVNTPYLTMHNDDDDAVPWYQGIEFFSALRRLGKEAYMFVYNGEKHGLRERDNQKHWTVHLCEYFDYFLKDAPRPAWMDTGVPYLEKGKRDVMPLFRKGEGQ